MGRFFVVCRLLCVISNCEDLLGHDHELKEHSRLLTYL